MQGTAIMERLGELWFKFRFSVRRDFSSSARRAAFRHRFLLRVEIRRVVF